MLLEMVPENLSGSRVRFGSGFFLLIYASYSVYLTVDGKGVEPPDAIFFKSLFSLILSASLAALLFLRGYAVKLGDE